MNYLDESQSIRYKNSSSCIAFEYEFENVSDINSAVIELKGRYPETGFAINDVCKEIVYVIDGRGYVACDSQQIDMERGGMLSIEPGEKYFFEGSMRLLIASSPAWYPEQYHNIVT